MVGRMVDNESAEQLSLKDTDIQRYAALMFHDWYRMLQSEATVNIYGCIFRLVGVF